MDVSGVTSQIMELKTSTPYVTRHEEIKTGFKNINDYSKYLQEKYPEMNTGTKNMYGVPVQMILMVKLHVRMQNVRLMKLEQLITKMKKDDLRKRKKKRLKKSKD